MDIARDRITQEYIEAESLWTMAHLDTEGFICRGCPRQVFPASFNREVNLKRPYFRLGQHQSHWDDCPVVGETKLVASARKKSVRTSQGFPLPFSSRVVLDEDRPQVADLGEAIGLVAPGRPAGQGRGAPSTRIHHGHTVRTIRSVYRAFLNMPFDRRSLPLQIPGVAGTTYAEVFRHANSALHAGGTTALFYAPLRWKAETVVSDDACEITLSTGVWDDAARDFPTPMRVRLDWANWKQSRRDAFLLEYGVAKEEARSNATRNAKVKGWMFFVGTSDAVDPTLFHVSAYRLVCCLTDELIIPKVSHAGRPVRRPA